MPLCLKGAKCREIHGVLGKFRFLKALDVRLQQYHVDHALETHHSPTSASPGRFRRVQPTCSNCASRPSVLGANCGCRCLLLGAQLRPFAFCMSDTHCGRC